MLGALCAAAPWLGQLGAAWVARPPPCPPCPACPAAELRCEPHCGSCPACPPCPGCPAVSWAAGPEASCPACPAAACEEAAAAACDSPAPAACWGFAAGLGLGLTAGLVLAWVLAVGLGGVRRLARRAVLLLAQSDGGTGCVVEVDRGDGRTLDVAESQICINFDDDENFRWHHRLLLVPGHAPGEWVAATPDGEILVLQLSAHLVVALTRNAPFPQRVRGNVYAFGDLDQDALEHLRIEGRNLARVLGVAVPAAPPGARVARWVIADPAVEGFGDEVEPGLAANADRFVGRDAVGLALVDDEAGWVAIENVQAEDHPHWVAEKRRGPGRDPRILPLPPPAQGKRVQLSSVIAALKPQDDPSWPFRGPKALP
ncbi:unnamed protein product, partial [Prorocentrum cordatum]